MAKDGAGHHRQGHAAHPADSQKMQRGDFGAPVKVGKAKGDEPKGIDRIGQVQRPEDRLAPGPKALPKRDADKSGHACDQRQRTRDPERGIQEIAHRLADRGGNGDGAGNLGTLLLLNLFRDQMKASDSKTEQVNGAAKQW